jgi:hypothetical protein
VVNTALRCRTVRVTPLLDGLPARIRWGVEPWSRSNYLT